jgi:hypothetical protein
MRTYNLNFVDVSMLNQSFKIDGYMTRKLALKFLKLFLIFHSSYWYPKHCESMDNRLSFISKVDNIGQDVNIIKFVCTFLKESLISYLGSQVPLKC